MANYNYSKNVFLITREEHDQYGEKKTKLICNPLI